MTPKAGVWYIDPELGHRFKVVAVAEHTLDVVDEAGNKRLVNRIVFESQMQESPRQPV